MATPCPLTHLANPCSRPKAFFVRFADEAGPPFGPALAVVGGLELLLPGGWTAPAGRLLVLMFTTYTLFINILANLSFSDLHMNITVSRSERVLTT